MLSAHVHSRYPNIPHSSTIFSTKKKGKKEEPKHGVHDTRDCKKTKTDFFDLWSEILPPYNPISLPEPHFPPFS